MQKRGGRDQHERIRPASPLEGKSRAAGVIEILDPQGMHAASKRQLDLLLGHGMRPAVVDQQIAVDEQSRAVVRRKRKAVDVSLLNPQRAFEDGSKPVDKVRRRSLPGPGCRRIGHGIDEAGRDRVERLEIRHAGECVCELVIEDLKSCGIAPWNRPHFEGVSVRHRRTCIVPCHDGQIVSAGAKTGELKRCGRLRRRSNLLRRIKDRDADNASVHIRSRSRDRDRLPLDAVRSAERTRQLGRQVARNVLK